MFGPIQVQISRKKPKSKYQDSDDQQHRFRLQRSPLLCAKGKKIAQNNPYHNLRPTAADIQPAKKRQVLDIIVKGCGGGGEGAGNTLTLKP